MRRRVQQRLLSWQRQARQLVARLEVGRGDVILVIGLVLLGRGFWMLSPAAGLIVPGSVLVWWGLPTRPLFIVRPPTKEIRRGD